MKKLLTINEASSILKNGTTEALYSEYRNKSYERDWVIDINKQFSIATDDYIWLKKHIDKIEIAESQKDQNEKGIQEFERSLARKLSSMCESVIIEQLGFDYNHLGFSVDIVDGRCAYCAGAMVYFDDKQNTDEYYTLNIYFDTDINKDYDNLKIYSEDNYGVQDKIYDICLSDMLEGREWVNHLEKAVEEFINEHYMLKRI